MNTSSLWGEEERAFLEDVTLNLVPDDDAMMDTKGKTVMKWDANKRRHILMKVDRDGKVIKEKKVDFHLLDPIRVAKGRLSLVVVVSGTS